MPCENAKVIKKRFLQNIKFYDNKINPSFFEDDMDVFTLQKRKPLSIMDFLFAYRAYSLQESNSRPSEIYPTKYPLLKEPMTNRVAEEIIFNMISLIFNRLLLPYDFSKEEVNHVFLKIEGDDKKLNELIYSCLTPDSMKVARELFPERFSPSKSEEKLSISKGSAGAGEEFVSSVLAAAKTCEGAAEETCPGFALFWLPYFLGDAPEVDLRREMDPTSL